MNECESCSELRARIERLEKLVEINRLHSIGRHREAEDLARDRPNCKISLQAQLEGASAPGLYEALKDRPTLANSIGECPGVAVFDHSKFDHSN